MRFVKDKRKLKNKRFFLLITFLFFTSYATSKIFKNVNYQDVSIVGSELFSIEDIVANSSLNLPTSLIFVKSSYTERELKKNLSLKNVSVFRQIFPFGLKILIKTRTPIAYGERIFKGEKITGFIDEDGFFISLKYSDQENLSKITSKVFGWKENFRETLSKILNYQKYNDVEFLTITLSPNGFLTLEEKSLNTIFLGFNSAIIETQLQIISDIKNQLTGREILQRIDNIDITDPNNPKIKVFKP